MNEQQQYEPMRDRQGKQFTICGFPVVIRPDLPSLGKNEIIVLGTCNSYTKIKLEANTTDNG